MLLHQHGVSLKVRNESNLVTSLMAAVTGEHIELAKLCLANGCDVQAKYKIPIPIRVLGRWSEPLKDGCHYALQQRLFRLASYRWLQVLCLRAVKEYTAGSLRSCHIAFVEYLIGLGFGHLCNGTGLGKMHHFGKRH